MVTSKQINKLIIYGPRFTLNSFVVTNPWFEYGALQMSTDNIYTSYNEKLRDTDVTQELYTNMLYTCDISSIMCVLQLGQFIVIKNYIEHLNWSHLNCVDMNYIKHGMDFFKQVRIVQQMCDINKFIKHGCSC